MTFGWVVGYPFWNSPNEHPYQKPIFNFQLLRNNDRKQIHQAKYWLGNFFGGPDPIPFFRVGPKKRRLFQQSRGVSYSKCPRLNSTHEISQLDQCPPGDHISKECNGCNGGITKIENAIPVWDQ